MRRKHLDVIVGAFSLALVAAGCGGGEEKPPVAKQAPPKAEKKEKPAEKKEEAPALDPRVEKAAKLAQELDQEPFEADAILEKNGLDRDGLDELMYEIAADPDLARSYRLARAEAAK